MNNGFQIGQLLPQVIADFAHGATDASIDFHVALHQLGLNRIDHMRRQCGHKLINTAAKAQFFRVDQLELNLHAYRRTGIGSESHHRHGVSSWTISEQLCIEK